MSKSQPLLPQSCSSPRISLTPDEISVASDLARQTLALAPACDLTITSPADNQAAVDFLRDRLDPAIDFCNELFNPILAAIDQLQETTRQSRQQLVGPLTDLKAKLRSALQAWDNHLREVQRQLDADRAAEVARLSREILEQDTLNKANELIENGDEKAATELLESFFDGSGPTANYNVQLPQSRLQGSRADGQSSSTLRRARVLDVSKLKPEYVITSPNTRAIQAAVTKYGKQAEQVVSIDGKGGAIEYYEKGSVTVRKRKPAISTDDEVEEYDSARDPYPDFDY